MKILFVANDSIPHIGGKSTHIFDLIDGLRIYKVNCDILSFSSLSNAKKRLYQCLLFAFRIINLELYAYCFRQLWAKELNRLVLKYCQNNEVSFISVQDAWAAYAIRNAVSKLNIPTIMTMHTYFGIENSLDKKMNILGKKIYNKELLCELSSLEVVDAIIAVDERIKKHVEDKMAEYSSNNISCKSVVAISNFTNTKKFRFPDNDEKQRYRKELEVANNELVICCARRLVEKNGVINLVSAMSYLKDKNIVAFIGGDGPQKIHIERYINENKLGNIVKLLGALDSDKVRKLYMASDISVVPSITVNGLQEATSISAIEAMACGLPTIASNIGGLVQLIENRKTGILVDEDNPEQIANAIMKLKSNPIYHLSIKENARKYIEENHSNYEVAKKYLEEFIKSKRTKEEV